MEEVAQEIMNGLFGFAIGFAGGLTGGAVAAFSEQGSGLGAGLYNVALGIAYSALKYVPVNGSSTMGYSAVIGAYAGHVVGAGLSFFKLSD